jgi:hypothetical protein
MSLFGKIPAFVLFTLLTFADVSNVPAEYRAQKMRVVLGIVQPPFKITQLKCVAVELSMCH